MRAVASAVLQAGPQTLKIRPGCCRRAAALAKGKLAESGEASAASTAAADAEVDRTNAARQSEAERMMSSIRARNGEYSAMVGASRIALSFDQLLDWLIK